MMKCNLMAWLRAKKSETPAFPVGSPFRPKEVKPVENNFIIGVDVGNKDECSITVFKKDWLNGPHSEELNRAINKITNSPTYKTLPEKKPPSAWRTGKPDKDGVYKVLSFLDHDCFARFIDGIWYSYSQDMDWAISTKYHSMSQNHRWQPIEEELPDGVYQTADGYEARCVCCEEYKPIVCDISEIPKIGYEHYCGGSPRCCP